MSVSRTTVVAIVVLLLTFIAGFATGMLTDHLLILWHRGHHLPPFATSAMARRLDRHLDLTDEQREKIEAILDRRHKRINDLWAGMRPRVHAEIDQTNAEIEKILTPEQRAKFAKMKMRLRRGGPPPPPHEHPPDKP